MSRHSGLVVISAPSGSGKTAIYKEILRRNPELRFSVSYTTRKAREGEVDGRDYFFVDRDAFEAMARGGKFVEWASVHGELYGTERSQLERCVAEGKVLLLDVDVQGAMNIMKEFPEAVTIFIEPPSMEELERRLRRRGTESDESVKRRLQAAKKELEYRNHFQYIVVNDRLDESIRRVEEIIREGQRERT